MVFFSTTSNPEPHFDKSMSGFPQPSMEVCLTNRDKLQNFMEANPKRGVFSRAFCVENEIKGITEALMLFKKELKIRNSDPT